jgi:hypothetical protein
LALAVALPTQGATVTWKAANAAIYLGLPSTQLEFENPLAGTETVLSHAVLDWRDADYNKSGHPLYDDWNVFLNGGTIDGDLNEIWMRKAGQSLWTTTLVPSQIISIHMTGDNNDGLANVLVDGTTVASLNMWNAAPGGTVLIIVSGLANTTHTIEIDDASWTGANTDVHTFGAAALAASPVKWDQPPVPGHPTNNFYYGWNEVSMYELGPIAADDWVCTNAAPVTDIHWWGSFYHWCDTFPPQLPDAFQIAFWTDVPTNTVDLFSHPGQVLQTIWCTNYTWQFVGWDFDPIRNMYEACFKFDQFLNPQE